MLQLRSMKWSSKWFVILIVIVFIVSAGTLIIENHKKDDHKSVKTPVINNSIIVTKYNSLVGNYLASPGGRALYEYDRDRNNFSSCYGSCIKVWPPYEVSKMPKKLPPNIGYIKRSDTGEYQYTYKGLPLYFYSADRNGSVYGNAIAGFFVAKP